MYQHDVVVPLIPLGLACLVKSMSQELVIKGKCGVFYDQTDLGATEVKLAPNMEIGDFRRTSGKLAHIFACLLRKISSRQPNHNVQFIAKVRIGLPVTPVVTKVLSAVRTLDRFGISDRAGAAIVSAALQDVGIISESNVLNVVDRNKIRRVRTKTRTTLLSQVIKDYDHDQFGLYFDRRKDRTLSMEDNRRKVIIEEHISLVKESASEYIGHVSVNFDRAQIIGNNIYSFFLSSVDNDIDVTKLVATEHLSTQVSKEVLYVTWN
ncbi:hypothetical protein AVEN_187567-1 [Araneus ventricosus]|uniref:Uncharacterized protein n=1 Tax=Araneus ventricosus TaxID=182803 RepID=A0A4Y2RBJ6_ARAVE|nr:hypothetical protein AVEN_187567-1 [Araneus ventricosus]